MVVQDVTDSSIGSRYSSLNRGLNKEDSFFDDDDCKDYWVNTKVEDEKVNTSFDYNNKFDYIEEEDEDSDWNNSVDFTENGKTEAGDIKDLFDENSENNENKNISLLSDESLKASINTVTSKNRINKKDTM